MHDLPIDPYFIERAKSRRGGRLNAYESLTPSKTALVVVDMQDYFVKDGMPSPVPGGRAIVANINRLAQAVRGAKGLVIWIQTEVPADADDWANRREATSPEVWSSRRELLARNGDGFAIFAALDVRPEDPIAIKIRYSAFIPHPSELDALVRERGIDTLLITGVATSTCCDSTARDASMWGLPHHHGVRRQCRPDRGAAPSHIGQVPGQLRRCPIDRPTDRQARRRGNGRC
ncbi:MAG: cysteine hydrolase [Proteobacteria bacterium]|nr:cysteine hydrolase [Pseudomonadota bacterium]